MLERIEQRLKIVRLNPSRASLDAGLSKDAIRNLQRGTSRSMQADSIAVLAPVLKTNVEWLTTGRGDPDEMHAPLSGEGGDAIHADTLPIYGRAAGAILGAEILSDTPVDHLHVPTNVLKMKDAYALWVDGTSMIPKFEPGEPIIGAPHRPVRGQDFVIAQVMQNGNLVALVKRYVSQNEKHIKLEQFNKHSFIEIPHGEVYALHRILTTAEILGL